MGKIDKGETITLSYSADITLSVVGGDYKDNAWASGTNIFEDPVISFAGVLGYLSDNFVGTKVNVTTPYRIISLYEVLKGDEIVNITPPLELPETGNNKNTWLFLISATFWFAAMLLATSRKWKFATKLGALVLVGLSISLFSASSALAQDLNIQINQPASPTNDSKLNISYAFLDTQERNGSGTE